MVSLFRTSVVLNKLLRTAPSIRNKNQQYRYLSLGNIMMLENTNRKPNRMFSWAIHNYTNDVNEIVVTESNMPTIESPTQLLVKISASSVNPIDVAMMSK